MSEKGAYQVLTEADKTHAQIENNFTYHAPKHEQIEWYREIRDQGKILAQLVQARCPPSRERSLAFTKIEEAVMWANASIARNE